MGPHGEFFIILIKKEPVAVSNDVPTLCLCGNTNGVCADWSTGQSPELGNMWRQGGPKSPEWIGSCSASEPSLGCEVYEHNNGCWAIEVVGQDRSSEVVALFVEDWELGRVALSCHMTMDRLCQEMRDACWESSESLGSPCPLCSQCQKGSLEE